MRTGQGAEGTALGYDDIITAMGALVLAVDPDLRITHASPSVSSILGVTSEEIAGQRLDDLLDMSSELEILLDETRPHAKTTTHQVQHRDGSTRSLEVSFVGQLGLDPVNVIARDVTERAVAQSALKQAEERFRLAFDMAPIGNAIVLPGGRFMRVNSKMSALLRIKEADLLGRRWSDFISTPDKALLTTFLSDLIATDDGEQTVELRLSQRSGRPVHTSVTASVVHDGNGRPAYVIAQIEDITERKLAQAALRHQATHDALTALPNRTMLLSHLQSAIDRQASVGGQVGLLFCDLDHFKRINDSLGHETGDLLLIEMAKRLQRSVRSSDIAGRLGGDEFLVICEDLIDDSQAEQMAERIRAITDEPVTISGHKLQVQLSIGVAFAGESEDASQLLRRADTAMYAAKAQGRGRVEIYDDTLRARARARLQVETDLRTGVYQGQMLLHHQPIVDLLDARTVGHEALVRWQHPSRGLLAPCEFIEIAEESDLIVELGSWVLDTACGLGPKLQQLFPNTKLGVNVSARQLGRPDFRGRVEKALAVSGMDPNLLVLELTETSLLHASEGTLADVQALADLGISLAIDDFLTGYSSLTYLSKLPVSIVKIDRSFIADLATDTTRQAITKAVLTLGEALSVDVVAKGVETEEQADQLRDLGCKLAQGYLFGRPAPLSLPAGVSTVS